MDTDDDILHILVNGQDMKLCNLIGRLTFSGELTREKDTKCYI